MALIGSPVQPGMQQRPPGIHAFGPTGAGVYSPGDPNAGGPQRARNFPSGEDRSGLLAHLANMLNPGWAGQAEQFGRQPIFHGNNLTHMNNDLSPAFGQEAQQFGEQPIFHGNNISRLAQQGEPSLAHILAAAAAAHPKRGFEGAAQKVRPGVPHLPQAGLYPQLARAAGY